MNITKGLSFNDVLLNPQYSDIRSRSDVDLSTEIGPDLTLNIPLIVANMDTVCSTEMAVEISRLGGIAFLSRFMPITSQAEMAWEIRRAGGSCVGTVGLDDTIEQAKFLVGTDVAGLCFDVAYAHTEAAIDAVRELRKEFPDTTIIAGNIATYQGAEALFYAGADTVKVGVGPGACCTTRIKTGCGVPQITAITEASRARDELFEDRYVIADGGAVHSGDIVKALAAGADAYMGGFLFAGTNECPGSLVTIDGKKYRKYNGSASLEEKKKREQSSDYVEGVSGLVEAKGSLEGVVKNLCAGIRSGMSYVGARNIFDLQAFAEWIEITPAGYAEGLTHGVI